VAAGLVIETLQVLLNVEVPLILMTVILNELWRHDRLWGIYGARVDGAVAQPQGSYQTWAPLGSTAHGAYPPAHLRAQRFPLSVPAVSSCATSERVAAAHGSARSAAVIKLRLMRVKAHSVGSQSARLRHVAYLECVMRNCFAIAGS
jgi:hypothetical protein